MPTVPVYQRSVQQRPALRQGIEARANANDFGGQVAQAQQSLAQGIDNVGDAVAKVNALKDETAAREARNAWMREKDDIYYNPENGYLNQSGKNALDSWQSTQERVRAARAKYAEGLSPGAARLYNQSVDALETDAMRSGMVHNGNELKQYVVQEGIAGASNFQNEALRNSSNPAMADKYTAAAIAELRDVYGKQGLPPEAIQMKENEFLSDTTRKMALTLAAKGPDGVLAAQSYIEKNAARLSPGDKLTLDDALKAPLLAAKATRNMQSLVSGAPVQRYDGPERVTPAPRQGIPQVTGNIGQVLGSLKGLTETRDSAAISSFIKNSAGISIDPRVTPWCAAFVNAVLATQGIEGTGKLNARSFLNFGLPTDNPQPGDVVVFKRGNSEIQGHVGFFNGFDQNGNIIVTGGNQSNSVKTSTYKKEDLLGFRTAGAVSENTAKMPNYSPQGIAHIYDQLSQIRDPEEREATRKAVDAYYTSQKKVMDAQREQVQTWAEQQVIANPSMSISSIPIETQQVLGASGMTTLMSYQEKVRSQGQPTTDYKVLYDLQTQYANNPASFSQTDLFQYRDKLSNSDWQTVTGWRQTALTDQRKAQEDGSMYSSAFKQAEQSLSSAGLTTTGIKSDNVEDRAAMEARIGRFQSELKERIDEFKKQNGGKSPTFTENQKLINELLLPIVIQKPGTLWGTNETDGQFLFEANSREEGTSFEVKIPYEDIPTDLRDRIKADLRAATGRAPSQEDVSKEYARFLLGQ
ncbi:TIGR02594 family protein [Agrobacterium tumefaciens]|uniref:TIGR02594 family protein n=1 Tax=Agrobacterium tumefaciens TaxID=358 RepID=UPI000459DF8E|nr:TIGR02594 family protein [Agrobacterium tumefaciens]CDN96091.1 Muramidase (Phage lambda lysozyme) [Agrobacterium tumefaciens]